MKFSGSFLWFVNCSKAYPSDNNLTSSFDFPIKVRLIGSPDSLYPIGIVRLGYSATAEYAEWKLFTDKIASKFCVSKSSKKVLALVFRLVLMRSRSACDVVSFPILVNLN